MVTEAGQLRNRGRPDAAADAFDTECSTLSPADRKALIGETALKLDQHNNQPLHRQNDHDHHQHSHHHHHHHDHYEHPHPDDVADTRLQAIGAKTPIMPSDIGTDYAFQRQIVWSNAIGFAVLHALAVYGLVLTVMNYPLFKTTLYCECGCGGDLAHFERLIMHAYARNNRSSRPDLRLRSRRDDGRPPAVVASLVQGAHAAAPVPAVAAHAGRPELPVRVGARPSAAPQVLGHRCGSAQRQPRVLLLARRLADVAQASAGDRVWPQNRYVRSGGGRVDHVPEAVSIPLDLLSVKIASDTLFT